MKNRKIINIFLIIFVLIPLNFLLHTGFFQGCLVKPDPIYMLSYDSLSEGKYSLWGYRSGENVGEININIKDDNFIEINVITEVQEGKDYILDKDGNL